LRQKRLAACAFVGMFPRQVIIKAQYQRAVPDGPWIANAIGRARSKQYCVTWGADHVSTRRLVFRKDAADGKHYGIGRLSLDIAACLRSRPHLE